MHDRDEEEDLKLIRVAAAEVIGPDLQMISAAAVQEVVAAFPRGKKKRCFIGHSLPAWIPWRPVHRRRRAAVGGLG